LFGIVQVCACDSLLGAAAVLNVCERAGLGTSLLTTASGFVNGMGSLGAMTQVRFFFFFDHQNFFL
jgi:hypothetical protein